MFTDHVTNLPEGQPVPLFVLVNPKNSLAPWCRVGTLTRTADSLRVELCRGAEQVLPAWQACAEEEVDQQQQGRLWSFGRRQRVVRFGVPMAGGGMQVVAQCRLTSELLDRARLVSVMSREIHEAFEVRGRRQRSA